MFFPYDIKMLSAGVEERMKVSRLRGRGEEEAELDRDIGAENSGVGGFVKSWAI